MWANAISYKDATKKARAQNYQETSSQMSPMEDFPADSHQQIHMVDDQMQSICNEEYSVKEKACWSWKKDQITTQFSSEWYQYKDQTRSLRKILHATQRRDFSAQRSSSKWETEIAKWKEDQSWHDHPKRWPDHVMGAELGSNRKSASQRWVRQKRINNQQDLESSRWINWKNLT